MKVTNIDGGVRIGFSEFELRRARRAIDNTLTEIRQTGRIVSIIHDCEVFVIVDAYSGEGDCLRLCVDPLQFAPLMIKAPHEMTAH